MGLQRIVNMFRNITNWNEYLLYKLTGKKKDSFTFKLNNGFSVTVPKPILPEFKECVFEEAYFKHLPDSILNTNHPTILDIGANVGFFSIYSSAKFISPRIIAFEPINRNYLELKKNTTGISADTLTIVNKAVSHVQGELVLKFDKNQSITTSASLFDNKYGQDEETVLSTTLEHVITEFGLTKIDLLKLDCEGAEYGIIYQTPPSVFELIRSISLETHTGKESNENNAALASYLKQLGYTVVVKPDAFIWAYKQ